jgi:L-lactate dehydrogenase complex protein LldG
MTAGGHASDGSAREDVLARIRSALADKPAPPPVPSTAGLRPSPTGEALIELFADRVADYRASVHRTTVAELPGVVAQIVRGWGAQRVVVPSGVPDEWLGAAEITAVGDVPPLSHDALDVLDGVITGCAVGIAESGTIVLDASAGQGRRALSLLPDRHLCVIRTDQIVHDVPDALPLLDPRRPLTWISGPSATSDIELQRVEGVHGPRVLDVVIVGPEAPLPDAPLPAAPHGRA